MDQFKLLKNNDNFIDYYYFDSFFDNDEVEKIKELSKNYQVIDGNIGGDINYDYRKSKIRWLLLNDETRFIYDKIVDLMKIANDKMWNFNITTMNDSIQFSEYSDNYQGFYDWHMDVGSKISTRKLSMIVQLTDPDEYEGGNLEFMFRRDVMQAPRTKGTVIFFPSFFMHRVTKVTRGTRNSLVYWFEGPTFV